MARLGGLLFWAFLAGWVFLIRRKSRVHQEAAVDLSGGKKIFLSVMMAAIIVGEGFLMTLSPLWNGEIPGHRNQYELITESFLQGRLDFDYEVDPILLEMENPYDMEQREALGAEAHFDHAFYQGKYYMYFGVVPVLLAFLPWRVVTGQALVTWQATFFFTAVFLIGLAVFFRWLIRRFFPRVTWGAFVSLLAMASLASTVYVVKYPALYQTPVACGMMLEIWSLYCFCRAFCREKTEHFPLPLAAAGSLLGALTFGCRPPLGLANLLLIPLLVRFLRGRRISGGMVGRLLLSVAPYALVAAGLMWYNAARFDNPFEFGQTYQMTITDQTAYSAMFTVENLVRAPAGIFNSLFVVSPIDMLFPWLRTGSGALAVCPMLVFSFAFVLPRSRNALKQQGMLGFAVTAMLAVMAMAAVQIMWSPKLLDRYQSDFLWLLSVGTMLGVGAWFARTEDGARLSYLVCAGCLICVVLVALLFLVPWDASFTDYDEGAILRIWNVITLKGIR